VVARGKHILKLILIVAAAVLALTPLPRDTVERAYSRGVYPIVQPVLTALSNRTPFAWFDVTVVLALGLIAVMWFARLRRRSGRLRATLASLGVNTAAIAAALYLWFFGVWGLNYQRLPLREQLDFREERISPDALSALAGRTVDALNTLHPDAHAAGWPELPGMSATLEPAFVRAQRELAMSWTARPGRPKRTLLNFYFTRVAVDGMTGPFFLETLANQTLLPFERAATVAHEWGHLAGYADESEANFVGWLVCMRGDVPAQYSGWLALYGSVAGALPRSERAEIARRLDEGPRADLRAISERVRRYVIPTASRAGYALYDRYLKANRVEAGVRSYGEVVRLLLGTRFNEDGSPATRDLR
jgi:hypothetical protein